MTLSEFKAWFEGFTENVSKLPTQKQWARIQQRVKEIETPEPERVIERHHDHYPWRPWWPTWYSSTETDWKIRLAATTTDTTTTNVADNYIAEARAIGAAEAQTAA